MKYIELGYGYRLRRLDSANWELDQWKAPNPNHHLTKSTEPKWVPLGKYYQRLSHALAAVYEMVLRDPGEDGTGLQEALDRAEGIASTLLRAAGTLPGTRDSEN